MLRYSNGKKVAFFGVVRPVAGAIFSLVLLLALCGNGYADIVYFKDGRAVETPAACEEGNQVKCERFGSIIGYPKNEVDRIERKTLEVNKALLVDRQDDGGVRVDIPGEFVSYTMEAWILPISKMWAKRSDMTSAETMFCRDYFKSMNKKYTEERTVVNPVLKVFALPKPGYLSDELLPYIDIQSDGRSVSSAVIVKLESKRYYTYKLERTARNYTIKPNHWTRLALSVDGHTSSGHLYMNGQEIARLETTYKLGKNPGSLLGFRIGHSGSGYIDEVRFWDRDLAAEEIGANMRRKLIGDENGLVLYYDFNQPGSVAEDLSGNGNHGQYIEGKPFWCDENRDRRKAQHLMEVNSPLDEE